MEELTKNRYPYIRNSIALTLLITIFFQFSGFIFPVLLGEDFTDNNTAALQAVSQLLFLLIPTLMFSYIIPIDKTDLFRIRENPRLRLILLSIPAFAALYIFANSLVVLQEYIIPDAFYGKYEEIKDTFENLYSEILGIGTGESLYVILLSVALVPAVTEELLFRGLLQRSLEERMRPAFAIMISGLLFGFLHFNPITILALISIGIFLGFTAYISRSIVLPIIIHGMNNLLSVIFARMEGMADIEQGNMDIDPLSLLAVNVSALMVLLLFMFLMHRMAGKK